MGSGVIVDPSGYILTNNHVVGFADEIDVRLWDRREFRAELIGTDEKTDLAVIKIKANDLVAATLGDSDNLHIGEWVVAAGNPFGLDNSITQGIVSATGRSNVGIVDYEDFIQTDAAINPGNSGGPLVNLKGEVIGINSAIFSRSGGYMGIGFAIPVNMARTVMKSLIKDGRVVRGWLGVAIQDLDKDMAASFGFKGTEGALIGDLTPDGPADRAGIKQGDIVVRYDGQVVTNVTQLRNLVAATKPGERVDLIVFRDGTEKSLRVKIGELKAEQRGIDAQEEPSLEIGVAIQAITPEIAQQLGVSSDEGVVVSGVEPGSVAESAGLRVRDVILKINGKSVNSVQEFRDLMKKSDLAKGVRLTVQSGDFQRYVFLKTRG